MKIKRLACFIIAVLLLAVSCPIPAQAITIESTKESIDYYVAFLRDYEKTHNNNKPYWNSNTSGNDNSSYAELKTALDLYRSTGNKQYLEVGITPKECQISFGLKHIRENGCTSNSFNGGRQCHGFAQYFCYYLFGKSPIAASTDISCAASNSAKNDKYFNYYYRETGRPALQAGDFVRSSSLNHSFIVHHITNGRVYLVDCNHSTDTEWHDDGNCVITATDIDTNWLNVKESTITADILNGRAYVCRYKAIDKTGKQETLGGNGSAVIYGVTTARYSAQMDGSYTLYGMASASSTIAECGMYIGTSENNLTKLGSDKINTNKTDMWYNTTKYGYKLEPGTTYYYQAYAIPAGSTTPNKGEVKSFVTPGNTVTGSISLNRTVLTINADERFQLTATTVPANQPVTWTSSDPSVATVENGTVVALKQGETIITANMTYGGNTAVEWCSVTVTEKVQPKISLNSTSLSIKNTECIQLMATTIPANQTVVWSSSDTSVATVDGGSIVAKKAGTAVITAVMDYEGKSYSASCTIKVEADGPKVFVVTGNASDITATSAVLHGSGSCDGANITGCGMYIGTSTGSLTKLGSDSINTPKTDMWYNTAKYGYTLSAATTYYYQAYIVVDGQLYWGDVESFRTTDGLPPVSVITGEAGDITASSAVLYGSGSSSGANITGCGMYIGTSTGSLTKLGSDSINTPKTDMWYSTAKYGYTLSPGTTYYYQAYIVVDGQLYWGDVRSFTTPAAAQNTSTRIGIVTGTGGNDLAINDRPAASPANSNMIGRIPPGGQVIVYPEKTSGNWYWVEYNGVQGYAYKAYITLQ